MSWRRSAQRRDLGIEAIISAAINAVHGALFGAVIGAFAAYMAPGDSRISAETD